MAWLYIAAYLLLLIPTYILPYFGSNSSLVNVVSTATGMGMTPLWWLHAWCLVMLVILGWWRGRWTARAYLPVFPFLAGAFDLIPILNLVPLVPTVMHLIGMVVGVIVDNRADSERIADTNSKAAIASAIATAVAILGTLLFISGIGRMAASAKAPPKTPAQKVDISPGSKPAPTKAPGEAAKLPDTPSGSEKTNEAAKKESSPFDAKPSIKEAPENPPEPMKPAQEKQAQNESKPDDREAASEKKTQKPRSSAHARPAKAPKKANQSGGSVRYIIIR